VLRIKDKNLQNGYPIRLIETCLRFARKPPPDKPIAPVCPDFAVVPYYKGLFELFARLMAPLNVRVVAGYSASVGNCIKPRAPADPLRSFPTCSSSAVLQSASVTSQCARQPNLARIPKPRPYKLDCNQRDLSTVGAVYSIPCEGCPAVYFGETGRPVGRRLAEHEAAFRLSKSANLLSAHCLATGHHPNLSKLKIEIGESNLYVRKQLEAWLTLSNPGVALNQCINEVEMTKWVKFTQGCNL
jgi:hypothetical protein